MAWTDGFWQREPDEGAPPSEDTAFRVLYDDDALYIAIRAHDRAPERIRALSSRRDQDSASDWLFVAIDSYRDRRTAFVFGLNPAGVQRDFLIHGDSTEDPSWDAVWEGEARIDERGWVAELRIPYSQLRFADADVQRWGFQVFRVLARESETSFWSPSPRDRPQVVSLFGELGGIRDIEPKPRVEIVPHVLTDLRLRDSDPADPFAADLSPGASAGVDVEYGVTTDLTLSATINPDFGQVEVDPSEINLTAQETFLAEKRPFFVEGANIFRVGMGFGDGAIEELFYSRRIGAAPSIAPSADATHVSVDPMTSILGAAKLSGKTRSGWSIGALTAITGEESAKLAFESGERATQVVEPLTSYSALRVARDFNGGRTTVGSAATAVARRLDGTGVDTLHDRAFAGGVDVSHRFSGEGGWIATAQVLGSHVHGDPAAIAVTQTASQRYYQRPDAEHLSFDPTRTRLEGVALQANVGRFGGKSWRGATGFEARSPGFEINDLGFQHWADGMTAFAWIQRRDDVAGDHLRTYQINLNTWTNGDFAGTYVGSGGNVNAYATARNMWGYHSGIGVNLDALDAALLRGGPAVRGMNHILGWHGVDSDRRRPLYLSATLDWNVTPASGSWMTRGWVDATWQVRSDLSTSIAGSLERRENALQYVGRYSDRHLLARIAQTTAALTVRVDYALTPRLSLQIYAQPFLSAGTYDRYKEAAEPRARSYDARFSPVDDAELMALEADGFSRPDFNLRELLGTAVLRWEYLPGSTLFVVWNHSRSHAGTGAFRLGRDLGALGDAFGEHVLLAKLSYRWAL